MGVHKNVGYARFPRQSDYVGRRVSVIFDYDYETTQSIGGEIVRMDLEDPYEAIIKLDDGRYVRTTECQYALRSRSE